MIKSYLVSIYSRNFFLLIVSLLIKNLSSMNFGQVLSLDSFDFYCITIITFRGKSGEIIKRCLSLQCPSYQQEGIALLLFMQDVFSTSTPMISKKTNALIKCTAFRMSLLYC